MMRLGILGLPNVGKSSLFNLLTNQKVPVENYPFTTIEPNIAVVPLEDERLARIAHATKNEIRMPATFELVDVAGLIEGASSGAGLGNQFLGHIRDVEGIIHVVSAFDPINRTEKTTTQVLEDLRSIEKELVMADIDVVDKHRVHAKGHARTSQDPKIIFLFETLDRLWRGMREGVSIHALALTAEEQEVVRPFSLLTMKKTMVVLNVQDTDSRGVEFWKKELRISNIAVLCIQAEIELRDIEDETERALLRSSFSFDGTVDHFFLMVKHTFSLRTFFTYGKGITKGWLIREGTTAKESSGLIHAQLVDAFVRARVYTLDILEQFSEKEITQRELFQIVDKNYIVQDGDILWFVTT